MADDAGELEGFKPIRKLAGSRLARPKATIVGLGPVLLKCTSLDIGKGRDRCFRCFPNAARRSFGRIARESPSLRLTMGDRGASSSRGLRGTLGGAHGATGSSIPPSSHIRGWLSRWSVWQSIISPNSLGSRSRFIAANVPAVVLLDNANVCQHHPSRRRPLLGHVD